MVPPFQLWFLKKLIKINHMLNVMSRASGRLEQKKISRNHFHAQMVNKFQIFCFPNPMTIILGK